MREKSIRDRMTSLVLIMIMVFSMLPHTSMEVYAASVTSETTGYKRPKLGYYVKTYYEENGQWKWKFTKAISTGDLHKYILERGNSEKNNWAYCIEPDKKIAATYRDQHSGSYWESIPKGQRDGIELAIKFGFQKNVCNVPGYSMNPNAQYVATQMVIWEYKEGIRTTPTSGKYSVRNSEGEIKIPYQTYYNAIKGKLPEQYYNKIIECIKTYYNGASFTKKTFEAAKANAFELSWNQSKQRWETTLTDNHQSGILATEIEKALGTDFQVIRSSGEDKYTIYTKKAISGTRTVKIADYQSDLTKGRDNEGRLLWVNDSTTNQPLITGSDAGVDLYISVKTEDVGTLKLKKETADVPEGIKIALDQFTFQIKSKATGEEVTAKTDDSGVFSVKLPAGKYTVTEKLKDGSQVKYWEEPKSETVTIEKDKINNVTFTNHWKKGMIKILKTASDGNVANVSFKVTGPGGFEQVVTTSEDAVDMGEIVLTDLKVGVYTIEELVSEGYLPQSPIRVDLRTAEDESAKVVKFHNIKYAGGIRIVKKDSTNGEIVKKEGFQFTIFDVEKGTNLVNPLTGDELFTTLSDGYTPYIELLHGGEYLISEVGVPEEGGYLLDAEDQSITVTDEELKDNKTFTVIMADTPQKGVIKIIKEGMQFVTVDENGKIKTPVYAEKALEGAVFVIKAAEDILSGAGEVVFHTGDVVETLTTDQSGIAETNPLHFGEYTVQEIKAPSGFLIDGSEPREIEITSKNSTKEFIEFTSSFTNINKKVRLHLQKCMQDDQRFQLGNGEEIKDVVFGLFAAEELVAVDGKRIEANDLIKTLTLEQEGEAIFEVALPEGKYYVKEIATDEHYILDDEKYDFEVVFDHEKTQNEYVDVFLNKGKEMINEIDYKEVVLAKEDSESKVLINGAEFGIWKGDETEFNQETALDIRTTENGRVCFGQLIAGSYKIKEIKAPEGYLLSEEIIDVVLSSEDEIVSITAENGRPKGQIIIYKTGESFKGFADGQARYEEEGLSGAVFDIFAAEDISYPEGKLLIEKGTKVDTIVTGDDGVAISGKLDLGRYVVIEQKAPDGFTLEQREYFVTLSYADEQTELVTAEMEISNQPIKGGFELTKKDEVSGEPLAGAHFQIRDEAGNVVYQGVTEENGKWLIVGIPYGQYTYTETKAPEGYVLEDKEYKFTIEEDGVLQKAVVTNEKVRDNTPSVPTGDTSNLVQWLTIAGFMTVIIILFGRRKNVKK